MDYARLGNLLQQFTNLKHLTLQLNANVDSPEKAAEVVASALHLESLTLNSRATWKQLSEIGDHRYQQVVHRVPDPQSQ